MVHPPTPRVRDAMSMDVVSVVPEMTLRELALTFLEANVRGAPVLDRDGKLVGVVSEEEVMRLALGGGNGPADLDALRVADVMGPAAVVALPGAPLSSLLGPFVRDGARRAMVVENGMLLGVVTPVDALRALAGD